MASTHEAVAADEARIEFQIRSPRVRAIIRELHRELRQLEIDARMAGLSESETNRAA